jgi:hypothetical protein
VTLFTENFAGLSLAVATGHDAAGLRRVILPHPLNDRPEPEIRAALRARVAEIVEGLVTP